MERKIGEVFEYNSEWYQCMKGNICNDCAFYRSSCGSLTGKGSCKHDFRRDATNVIFKKLEKVGEPCKFQKKRIIQTYKLYIEPFISVDMDFICNYLNGSNTIDIIIKQNKKEDMEIDKVVMNIDDRDYLLDRLEAILHDTHCQQYKDEICEAFSKYIATENASNLKPFDLNAAKAGKPVCTRDGRNARIICFDRKDIKLIVALVTVINDTSVTEKALYYFEDGHHLSKNYDDINDLMMLPEKKSGWVNVYKDSVYNTKDEAIDGTYEGRGYIDTVKVSWEE